MTTTAHQPVPSIQPCLRRLAKTGLPMMATLLLGLVFSSCGTSISPHYSGDGSKLPKLSGAVSVNVRNQLQKTQANDAGGKASSKDRLSKMDADPADVTKRVVTEALEKAGAHPQPNASKTLHIDLQQLELVTDSSSLTIRMTSRVRWNARVGTGRTVSIQNESSEDMGLFDTPEDQEKLVSTLLSEAAEKTLSHPTIQGSIQ